MLRSTCCWTLRSTLSDWVASVSSVSMRAASLASRVARCVSDPPAGGVVFRASRVLVRTSRRGSGERSTSFGRPSVSSAAVICLRSGVKPSTSWGPFCEL
jgi:hypothetical protein